MSDISFSMSADEKDVTKALQNLIKENAKLRGEIQTGVNESKAAAAQEREFQKLREKATKDAVAQMNQLNAAAARIKDSVATPFEQAKKQVQELRTHLQAGRITTEEYRKAYADVAKELKDATTDHEAAAKATREHNDAVRQATQIAERYATREEKVAAEILKLNKLKAQGVLSSKDHARAIEAETAKLTGGAKEASVFGGALESTASKMTTAIGGLTSLAAIVAVLRAEWDNLIATQKKQLDAQLPLAQAQEQALQNLDQSMTPEAFLEKMRKSSKSLGMSERDLTNAASSALSAKGDKTAADAVDAVLASAKLTRFSPDQLPAMAGSALDLGKQLKMSPEESLGFLLQTQRTARTVNLKGVTENIAPGIIAGVNMGMTKESAAAVAASLSGTSVDPTGAPTGTAMPSLFMQLREFGSREGGFTGTKESQAKVAAIESDFTERKAEIGERKLPAAQKAALIAELKAAKEAMMEAVTEALPSFDAQEMLGKIQQDPELRKTFLAPKDQGGFGATFERKMQSGVEQLLTPGTQGFADYQAALKTQEGARPQETYDAAIAAKKASPAMQVAQLNQMLQNNLEQKRLSDPLEAVSAAVREARQTATTESQGVFAGKIENAVELVRKGKNEDFDKLIRDAEGLSTIDTEKLAGDQSFAEVARARVGAGKLNTVPMTDAEKAGVSQADKDRAAEARAMLEVLRGIKDALDNKAHAGVVAAKANDREGK